MFFINNNVKLSDKYDLAKFIEFDDDYVFDALNSYILYQLPRLAPSGEYVVSSEANRPDLLSYAVYGDTSYWWILMWYNQLLKPQDIVVGLKIKYPSMGTIEQLYRNISLMQKVS